MASLIHLEKNETICTTVSSACTNLGYDCKTARSIEELDKLLQEPAPDFYLIANEVPDAQGQPIVANGANAVQKIRSVYPDTLIVVYAGSNPPLELVEKGVEVKKLNWAAFDGFPEAFLKGTIEKFI